MTGDFYDGKRLATRYFFHHELPKTTAQFDLLDSGEPNHNRSGRKLVLAWRMHGPRVAPGRSVPSAISPFGCHIGKPARRLGDFT